MVGFGARALIAQAMQASGAPATEEEMPALVEIFLAHYRAHIADGSRPFPGVAETLTALKADGRAAGRADQQAAGTDRPAAAAAGTGRLFAAVYGAGRKPYTKPDPRIFHDVVRRIAAADRR